MQKYSILLLIFILSANNVSCISTNLRQPQSESSFHVESIRYDTKVLTVNEVDLRAGIMYESGEAKFKGCVLYLEGLADSILNHRPLFKALSQNGYRVIAFDYMGQGGSQGTMNHTRIYEPLAPGLEIGNQAKYIWNQYAHARGINGLNCSQSKKMLIGWSTGGLATYKLAFDGWADSVVLIAPGIHPKKFVGEGAKNPSLMFTLQQVITEKTLTRNKFEGQVNPHIDPIKPVSPSVVPLFAANLLLTSEWSHFWKIPLKVNGLVFLSSEEDTYVDLEPTKLTLSNNAPHFSVVGYNGALHEIDNELPDVANDLVLKTIQFFDKNSLYK